MANPGGRVVLDEEVARAAKERYVALGAKLLALQACNKELTCGLQGQEEVVAAERLWGDRRAQAQMREFANLTAELLAGRRGPKVQMEGMRIRVKVKKPENYDGSKGRNLDTWLFQVQEHLQLTVIPVRGHVPYAASLLRGNAALW